MEAVWVYKKIGWHTWIVGPWLVVLEEAIGYLGSVDLLEEGGELLEL